MRVLKMAMFLAGLALCAGQTLARPSQPQYSADGLYNLANSYARAGKPGLAVLNYERAALLAPDDPDINANLEYVRTSAHVAGRAYLTKSGYRFDDFAPYVYRTGDYGATWIRFRPASRPRR